MQENTTMSNVDNAPNQGANPDQKPSLLQMRGLPTPPGFEEATGLLPYKMTNDVMFHIVFEACPKALTAFVGALLHLSLEEIISVKVTNPITYDTVYSKAFLLDLKILLNGNTVLNIELQVENLNFWRERSLGYLCRAFDNLNRGDGYLKTKSAIHVGILDFPLDPKDKTFYSTYYMINERTQKKYSDKLRLSVLQLRQVANATEEDRAWHLDLWAEFFKAESWEEIHMIAEQDPYIAMAAQTNYRACTDERVRSLCEGREEGEKTLRTLQMMCEMSQQALAKQSEEFRQTLQQKEHAIQQAREENARLRAELDALRQQNRQ